MKAVVSIGVASALVISGAPRTVAQQAAPEQPPPFRTGIELVTVDVNVLDRQGRPLRGLAAADFSVSVGGTPRRVVSAEFLDRAGLTASGDPDAAQVSTNEGGRGGRIFVFVVDQNTLEPGNARELAKAATGLFGQLTNADRSGLAVIPVGPKVDLTWTHDRVREALQRVAGMAHVDVGWELGSLSEARDIASQNQFALRRVAERECGGSTLASGGGAGAGGGFGGGSAGAGGQPTGESAPGAATGTPPGGSNSAGLSGAGLDGTGGGFGNQCVRNLRAQAEATWRSAQGTSLTGITALRQILGALARINGDKTIVLISGGWPLDERDQMPLLSTVASEAAAARATVFSFFAPASAVSASRRTMTYVPTADEQVQAWPLETLASMTGGTSFRVQVGAESAFDRLGRELSGYYRIGVERAPGDLDGKGRPLKVQVTRPGATVRSRAIFDVRTYEDRDWSARLGAALSAPAQATAVGLRIASYVTSDRDNPARIRLMLAGEASRLQPGAATFQIVMRDQAGHQVMTEEQPLGVATADGLPFSANLSVAPARYTVRVAVMDAAGRVGSVDHDVDARRVPLGPLAGFGPLLVRVRSDGAEPLMVLDKIGGGERLALQLDLTGDEDTLTRTGVLFEIAASARGPALLQVPGALTASPGSGRAIAEGIADVRLLPPGRYIARARVRAEGDDIGDVRRSFDIASAPTDVTGGSGTSVTAVHAKSSPLASRAAATVPLFSLEQVLAPPMLTASLDRVAARRDAQSPAIQELIARARAASPKGLRVPDAAATDSPAAAAFLKGLALLAERQLDPAANEFRGALRAAPDFYPALVYLGACYAAGGRDHEAAGAWRTALIGESAARLHLLVFEALLRQGQVDAAFETMDAARRRWPDDDEITRGYATAAIAAGHYAEGLDAVDELIGVARHDAQLLEIALLVLHEAFANGQPVVAVAEDRTRMVRFAGAYRAAGGQLQTLVDTWLTADLQQ